MSIPCLGLNPSPPCPAPAPPSSPQDFIRQVCKPAYTNVFRDRDGPVGVVEFETADDMDRTIRWARHAATLQALACRARGKGGGCSGSSHVGLGAQRARLDPSRPWHGRACGMPGGRSSKPGPMSSPGPLPWPARRKLDDTEFRNPFDKAYVRLVEDRDNRGGERAAPRGALAEWYLARVCCLTFRRGMAR